MLLLCLRLEFQVALVIEQLGLVQLFQILQFGLVALVFAGDRVNLPQQLLVGFDLLRFVQSCGERADLGDLLRRGEWIKARLRPSFCQFLSLQSSLCQLLGKVSDSLLIVQGSATLILHRLFDRRGGIRG